MCRFLLVRSKNKIKPEKLLQDFASMCKNSHAPDGDWQGDGWGIVIKTQSSLPADATHQALQAGKLKAQSWEVYKSLKPIWEERDKFQEFANTDMFVAHVRSAGFPQHKGDIEFNQPFIQDGLCFVFNGMIKGVKIGRKLSGKIGAQKIFSLILEEKKSNSIKNVLMNVDKLLLGNSEKIIGLNIAVVQENKFYILCEYEKNSNYFGIRHFQNDGMTIICSEPIGDYEWTIMKKGEVLSL